MKQRRTRVLLIILLVIINTLIVTGATQSNETLDVEAMIEQMLDARQHQIQIPPLTQKHGSFSMVKAYHIQDLMAQEVARLLGPVSGYKVAYASKAAQKQFGMDEPARGPFFMTQRLPSGSTLPVEPIKDVAALKSYVKWVHPAFDAGNFPYTSDQVKPTPEDMIAIGTGAHVFVLGPAVEPSEVDIDAINLSLVRNGEKIRESPARDVMGSPWNSLLWCANNLTRSGHVLKPGMVVLCGTAAPAYKVKGNEIKGVFEGDCGALGKVTLTIK
jgi:2-keto-4-pentenoate hydratase